MRIAFDIRGIEGDKGGKGVWTMNVLKSILETDQENEYYLYTNKKSSFAYKKWPHVTMMLIEGRGFFWHWQLYKKLLSDKIDVFIATESYIVPFLHDPKKLKVAMVVHDLVAFKSPAKHQRRARWIETFTLGRAVRKAHWIFTVSQYTRKDLIERYSHYLNLKEKTKVVYAGVREGFFKKHDSAALLKTQKRYHLSPDYILMAGTLEPRKNIMGALEAYALLTWQTRASHRLVVVGKKGWYYEEIFQCVQSLKLSEQVTFLEYIPDEDLVKLMQGAKLFLFPSFYEGFGLPILEAMANGVPVLASRVSSIPELGIDAIQYADPHNPEDISRGMAKLLEDEHYAKTLILKGHEQVKNFSWEKTAELILGSIIKN